MPIAKVQMPDGRIGRFEVPEGTTEAQVMSFVNSSNFNPEPEPPKPSTDFVEGGTGGVMMPSHGQPTDDPEEALKQQIISGDIGLVNPSKFTRNFPGDAKNVVSNVAEMVTHPKQTFDAGKAIAGGLYKKYVDGEDNEVASAVISAIDAKYGSPEKFLANLENHPAEAAIDIGFGGGMAGGLVKKIGDIAGAGKVAEVGNKITKMANIIDVPNPAKAAGLIPKTIPRKLMESTAKASTVTDRVARNKFIDSLIKHGIVPNDAGLNKVWGKVEEFGAEVNNLIKSGKGKVRKEDLFRHIDSLMDDAKFSDAPMTNQRIVQKVVKEFDSTHGAELTAADVQKLKQGIYKGVNYDRKVGNKKPQFNELAKKDIALAAKEELETVYPELKALNAEEGVLLGMIEPLTKAVNRIANRDVFGMGATIKGGSGAFVGNALGGEQGKMAGFLLGVISSSPKLQARFAIILDRARKLAQKNTAGAVSGSQLQAARVNKFGKENKAIFEKPVHQ